MAERGHNTYSEEKKAAVMAALLTGQSVSSAAREYKIPRTTISLWANQSEAYRQFLSQKTERLGNLLIEYVATSLDTLRTQVEVFGDPTWIKKQPASEAAVLHGVIADKTIRILEALAGESTPPESGGGGT